MRDYRLYCLDGAGKFSRAELISARTDEDAIMIAHAARKPLRSELWHGDRLVAMLSAFAN